MKLWELTTLSYITQAWQWSPQLNDEISLFIKILLRQSCLNSQRIKLTTLGLRIEERKASASTGWVIRTMLISTMQQQCFFFACLSFISLLHIFVTINCCIHCNLTRRHTLPRHIHSKQKLRNCQTTNTLVMAMTTRWMDGWLGFITISTTTPYSGSEMVWQDHQWRNKRDNRTNRSTFPHCRSTSLIFGNIWRLSSDTPASQALHLSIDAFTDTPPATDWSVCRAVHGELGFNRWKKIWVYPSVPVNSQPWTARCGDRYDPQPVKRSDWVSAVNYKGSVSQDKRFCHSYNSYQRSHTLQYRHSMDGIYYITLGLYTTGDRCNDWQRYMTWYDCSTIQHRCSRSVKVT